MLPGQVFRDGFILLIFIVDRGLK